jgi:hypothetical protein
MKQILIFIIILVGVSGCLSNLNISEFFRKLEIKSPVYYEIINDNVKGFEEAITKEMEVWEEGKIEWITFWGEGRYACGEVVEENDGDEYVVVYGKYKMKGEESSKRYAIHFIPHKTDMLTNVFIDYSW